MSVQSMRNKYSNHPCFEPLIEYCDKNNISFEFMKETNIGKDYKVRKIYYILIEDILITSYVDSNAWNSISFMLAKAYTYLGLKTPESLKSLLEFFEGKNNV